MKLTLINIYPKDTMAKYLISSYVLKAYLEKFNKDNSIAVNVLNFNEVADPSLIAGAIAVENPDYIGYSCYVWNIEKILAVIKLLKGQAKAVHIMGGPEISPNRILTFPQSMAGAFYILGEGEEALLNLLNYFQLPRSDREDRLPAGVACLLDGKLSYLPNTQRIKNLDDIPSIYLTGAIEDRLYVKQQAFLETQRGCLFKCNYCVYHKNFPKISYYSLDRIFAELQYLIEVKSLSALRIFDAIFTSDIDRAKEIVKYLSVLKNERGIRLPWIYWEMTYNTVDDELVELIATLKYKEKIDNSSYLVPKNRPQHYSEMLKDYTAINCVGVQSFNDQSLKAVGRPRLIMEKFNRFIGIFKKYNVVLKLDLIMGLPFETINSYFHGMELFLPYFQGTDHVLNIHRLQILPGSDLEALCVDYDVQYSENAPHMVNATRHFPAQELSYASKLTAVLARIVNSPLRKEFYAAKERSEKSFFELLENIYNEITSSAVFADTRFVNDSSLDDDYWNSVIYAELPSPWLGDYLKKSDKRKTTCSDKKLTV